jgi:hypothetical protein
VINAPQRGGRLPGERASAAAAGASSIDATDATPLSDERIEGAPPPAANAEDQDAGNTTEAEAGNSDEQEAPAAAQPEPQPQAPTPPAPGNAAPVQTLGGPPAADEPPH